MPRCGERFRKVRCRVSAEDTHLLVILRYVQSRTNAASFWGYHRTLIEGSGMGGSQDGAKIAATTTLLEVDGGEGGISGDAGSTGPFERGLGMHAMKTRSVKRRVVDAIRLCLIDACE